MEYFDIRYFLVITLISSSDSQEFSKNRKNVFVGGEVELVNSNRQIRYNGPFAPYFWFELNYVRKILVIFSLFFYCYLIKSSFEKNNLFRFTVLPLLVGAGVLYLKYKNNLIFFKIVF